MLGKRGEAHPARPEGTEAVADIAWPAPWPTGMETIGPMATTPPAGVAVLPAEAAGRPSGVGKPAPTRADCCGTVARAPAPMCTEADPTEGADTEPQAPCPSAAASAGTCRQRLILGTGLLGQKERWPMTGGVAVGPLVAERSAPPGRAGCGDVVEAPVRARATRANAGVAPAPGPRDVCDAVVAQKPTTPALRAKGDATPPSAVVATGPDDNMVALGLLGSAGAEGKRWMEPQVPSNCRHRRGVAGTGVHAPLQNGTCPAMTVVVGAGETAVDAPGSACATTIVRWRCLGLTQPILARGAPIVAARIIGPAATEGTETEAGRESMEAARERKGPNVGTELKARGDSVAAVGVGCRGDTGPELAARSAAAVVAVAD